MKIQLSTVAFLMMFTAVPIVGQTLPGTAPALVNQKQAIRNLSEGLGSGDFAQRERAQGELEKLDYHAISALRENASTTADPEIKARLMHRLDEFEEQYASEPPPISLTLKDATWRETIGGLNKAIGRNTISGYGSGNFTLDVQDKPFWEVFRVLFDKKSPELGSSMGSLDIGQDPEHPVQNFRVVGAFLFAPLDLQRTYVADFQGSGTAAPPEMKFQFITAVDPRLLVVRYIPGKLTSVVDDRQNELIVPGKAAGFAMGAMSGGRFQWETAVDLQVPQHVGTKIVSAKGSLKVELGYSLAEMTIDNPGERLNKEFMFEGRRITITKWEPRNGDAGSIDFDASIARDEQAPRRVADPMLDPAQAVLFQQIDSENKMLGERMFVRGASSGSWTNGKGPVKLKIIVPTKTKLLDVPFEFTNLPIP